MGADMLIECFILMDGMKPDYEKGHKLIDKLTKKWEKDDKYPDHYDSAGNAADHLHSYLKDIEAAVNDNRRDVTTLNFPPFTVYLTGGESFGDSPTELFNAIHELTEHDVLDECGFGGPAIDTGRVLGIILKQTHLRPLLLGLDKDLDALIEHAYKEKKPHAPSHSRKGVGRRRG